VTVCSVCKEKEVLALSKNQYCTAPPASSDRGGRLTVSASRTSGSSIVSTKGGANARARIQSTPFSSTHFSSANRLN